MGPAISFKWMVIAGIVAGVATAGMLWLWYSMSSEARRLLEGLGLPPAVDEVSEIDVQGPDGSMPEIATRSFRVSGRADALERFYFARCQQTGFSGPRSENARLEPDLLCERWRTGGFDTVSLSTRCERDECRATLVVRSLHM